MAGGRWKREEDWISIVSDAVWIAVVVSLGVTQALQIALLAAMNRARGPAEAAYISILGTLAGLTLALTIRSLMGSRPPLPPRSIPPRGPAPRPSPGGPCLCPACPGLPWGTPEPGPPACPSP